MISFLMCLLFRKGTDFYKFILYSPSSDSFRCFLVEFLGHVIYNILSLANRDNMTYFPAVCTHFNFFLLHYFFS